MTQTTRKIQVAVATTPVKATRTARTIITIDKSNKIKMTTIENGEISKIMISNMEISTLCITELDRTALIFHRADLIHQILVLTTVMAPLRRIHRLITIITIHHQDITTTTTAIAIALSTREDVAVIGAEEIGGEWKTIAMTTMTDGTDGEETVRHLHPEEGIVVVVRMKNTTAVTDTEALGGGTIHRLVAVAGVQGLVSVGGVVRREVVAHPGDDRVVTREGGEGVAITAIDGDIARRDRGRGIHLVILGLEIGVGGLAAAIKIRRRKLVTPPRKTNRQKVAVAKLQHRRTGKMTTHPLETLLHHHIAHLERADEDQIVTTRTGAAKTVTAAQIITTDLLETGVAMTDLEAVVAVGMKESANIQEKTGAEKRQMMTIENLARQTAIIESERKRATMLHRVKETRKRQLKRGDLVETIVARAAQAKPAAVEERMKIDEVAGDIQTNTTAQGGVSAATNLLQVPVETMVPILTMLRMVAAMQIAGRKVAVETLRGNADVGMEGEVEVAEEMVHRSKVNNKIKKKKEMPLITRLKQHQNLKSRTETPHRQVVRAKMLIQSPRRSQHT